MNKQIEPKDLIEGKIYYYHGSHIVKWIYHHKGIGMCINGKYLRGTIDDSYGKGVELNHGTDIKELRLATTKEINWLYKCIGANKYIDFDKLSEITDTYQIY